jgi:hypothetical protein
VSEVDQQVCRNPEDRLLLLHHSQFLSNGGSLGLVEITFPSLSSFEQYPLILPEMFTTLGSEDCEYDREELPQSGLDG